MRVAPSAATVATQNPITPKITIRAARDAGSSDRGREGEREGGREGGRLKRRGVVAVYSCEPHDWGGRARGAGDASGENNDAHSLDE